MLTVKTVAENYKWNCVCDCGVWAEILAANLKNGSSTSCGCLRRKLVSIRFRKHGMSTSRAYHTWAGMKQRCYDPKVIAYPKYGGRGIRICKRWHVFENFLADMGEPSPGMSLDRIENDGNYEPGNCRWATSSEQNSNRSINPIYRGQRKSLIQLAREHGMSLSTLKTRLYQIQMPLAEALETVVVNRRSCLIEFDGEVKSLHQWGKESWLAPRQLHYRVVTLGWSLEKALATPLRGKDSRAYS